MAGRPAANAWCRPLRMGTSAPRPSSQAWHSTGLVAPLVLDRPMNGPAFLAYVEQFLAPMLRPGNVVVMDNLGAHKVAGVEDAIRAVGGQPALPAALLAGSEPNQAGVRQAQDPAPPCCRSHQGHALVHHRVPTRWLPAASSSAPARSVGPLAERGCDTNRI